MARWQGTASGCAAKAAPRRTGAAACRLRHVRRDRNRGIRRARPPRAAGHRREGAQNAATRLAASSLRRRKRSPGSLAKASRIRRSARNDALPETSLEVAVDAQPERVEPGELRLLRRTRVIKDAGHHLFTRAHANTTAECTRVGRAIGRPHADCLHAGHLPPGRPPGASSDPKAAEAPRLLTVQLRYMRVCANVRRRSPDALSIESAATTPGRQRRQISDSRQSPSCAVTRVRRASPQPRSSPR
jgi:hypothetical protein